MNERKLQTSRQTLSVLDIAEYLGISRSGAYNLMHAVDFPSFSIGGRIMVTRAAFERWLETQQTKGVGVSQASWSSEKGRSRL